ncbi:hypothetical protein GDO78_014334 [Eleutherodactylus coqui]|uniref:DNA repair protein complementing XP-C cells n=2 Tax=Eleutherodactylus coqui TaxID=57060 RepID=A0A8J6EQN2_ELECQ|nr:hypothetical protein GDO78_014334 [Eleutherodactylus coqui]
MGKRRGPAEDKPADKKPRRGAQCRAGGEDGSEDGKAPNKKSRAAAAGARTTRRADETPGGDAAGKKPTRSKKSAEKKAKEEDAEKAIEDLLILESQPAVSDPVVKEESGLEDGEDSDEEWEDVEELNATTLDALQATSSNNSVKPTESVEIEIETAEAAKKRLRREKKKAEFAAYLRRMMNRFSKELREDTHKVHLLCLFANGFFRSDTCNSPDLQAVALSVLPVKFTNTPAARIDVVYLTNLVKWFTNTFTLNPDMSLDDQEQLSARLERRFGVYGVRDAEEMVHLFLILVRALQLLSRLVLSLQPIPLKEPPNKITNKSKVKSNKTGKSQKSPRGISKAGPKPKKKKVETICLESSEDEDRKPSEDTASKKEVHKEKSGKMSEDTKKRANPKNQLRRKAASKVSYKEESESQVGSSDSDYSCSSSEDSDLSDWDVSIERKVKGYSSSKTNRRRSGEGTPKSPAAPGQPKAKSTPKDNSSQPKRRGKIISTDEEDEDEVTAPPPSRGSDQWVEVYLEKEEKWVCVDCVYGTVNQPALCFKAATKPVTYIVGIDNSGHVKDVTRRYDPEWMTSTRKRRVSTEWWEETLTLYRSHSTSCEEKEETEFEAKLLDQPLPTSITEYKSHPLYALKRHLLKYEAIYPESAATLGYCRGEPVYSRSCVHTLHSKDTWLKDARVVRLGEVPYKMVKGQSNRARKARLTEPEKDTNDLALFGLWQTEEYQPPIAVDGKVPRNDFGNVYLFKPSMLPIGCCHLQVSNLHRVARKLDIDCASAITGFDFHCGFSHPVTDGYIVCEEYKDVLLAAWENEQVEIERKQKEKREKRAMSNWKLLVKGLLIRERLKARYGQKDSDHPTSAAADRGFSSDEEQPATATPALDAPVSWPQNRKAEEQKGGKAKQKTKRERRGEEKHLFPFEKL